MTLRSVFFASNGRLRGGWGALLFLFTYGVLLVGGFGVVIRFVGRDWLRGDTEVGLLFNGFIGLSSGCLASWLLLRAVDRRSFRTLGLWSYAGWGRELALGLLGGLLMVSVIVGPLVSMGQIRYAGTTLGVPGAARALAWSLLLLVPAAANEEVVFRGYPFQRLVSSWGPVAATLVLSVLFGLGHFSNPAHTLLSTANTALAGILLALTYLKTRGLWLPIGLHFSWNFTMGFLYSLPVSGIVLSVQPWRARISEPAWLSGGPYGPEGSVLCTGVLLVAIGWLARTRRLGVSPALAKEFTGERSAPRLS